MGNDCVYQRNLIWTSLLTLCRLLCSFQISLSTTKLGFEIPIFSSGPFISRSQSAHQNHQAPPALFAARGVPFAHTPPVWPAGPGRQRFAPNRPRAREVSGRNLSLFRGEDKKWGIQTMLTNDEFWWCLWINCGLMGCGDRKNMFSIFQ